MTVTFRDIEKFDVLAQGEQAGRLKDILFDDVGFEIRYFVVDTGKWLPGRKVLLSPQSLEEVDRKAETVRFSLSKSTVEKAPLLEQDLPVSRQYEVMLHEYYSWAPYWTSMQPGEAWFPYPGYMLPQGTNAAHLHGFPEDWISIEKTRQERFDHHLRSSREISGYKIVSSDRQSFGEVYDLVFDLSFNALIDMVLSSHRWLPGGKHIPCPVTFITQIDERERTLGLAITKDVLLDSPSFEKHNYGEESRRRLIEHYLTQVNPNTANIGAPMSEQAPKTSQHHS